MALSDHEEQILAEIERGLAAEDPDFFERARRATAPAGHTARLRWAVVGFVAGLASLFALTFSVVWGVIGIGLMLVSAVVGYQSLAALGTGSADDLLEKLRRGMGRDTDTKA